MSIRHSRWGEVRADIAQRAFSWVVLLRGLWWVEGEHQLQNQEWQPWKLMSMALSIGVLQRWSMRLYSVREKQQQHTHKQKEEKGGHRPITYPSIQPSIHQFIHSLNIYWATMLCKVCGMGNRDNQAWILPWRNITSIRGEQERNR